MPARAPASSSGGSHDDGTIFARAEGVDRVTRAPTLANAGYPFVTHHHHARASSSSRSKPTSTTTTTTTTTGRRKTTKDGARSSAKGSTVTAATTTRAYVRVEDVIESTRAAEEALKRAATSSDTALASERERVKRYAQAQIEVAEQRRAVEEKERENRVLTEENERLARELGAALASTSKQRRDSDDEDDNYDVDETVKELFEMVEIERRERRALEEKLGAYERDVERTLGDARNESDDARRRVEDAEATVREQEMKLSQAADIIGELRTALLQVMETRPEEEDDASTRSRARSEAPSDAIEAPGGTPLERTTAAVRVWESKVEKLVMETVHSALTRAMDSPALQSSKREGEQVISSVTDAINHELSAIVENAMSGIVDEMRFQFGQNENEDEDDVRIGGRKRFIVWLADENMRRAHLEEQLHTVQDELARSEASRQIATQRWLQAMNQVDGSVYDDESDLGDILSRLDEYSDDGTSVYSVDESKGIRNRRASSVAGDLPARSRFRTRHDGARSETHDYANLRDVSPIKAFMPAFVEGDEKQDDDDEAHADIAIVATPGGRMFLAIRSMMRTYVFPLVYAVSKCVYAICAICASSPTFELVWPVALMLLAFYWKLGAFAATSGAVASVAPTLVAKTAATAMPTPHPVQDAHTSASIPRAIPMPPGDRLRIVDL